jgi:hypothetical protein
VLAPGGRASRTCHWILCLSREIIAQGADIEIWTNGRTCEGAFLASAFPAVILLDRHSRADIGRRRRLRAGRKCASCDPRSIRRSARRTGREIGPGEVGRCQAADALTTESGRENILAGDGTGDGADDRGPLPVGVARHSPLARSARIVAGSGRATPESPPVQRSQRREHDGSGPIPTWPATSKPYRTGRKHVERPRSASARASLGLRRQGPGLLDPVDDRAQTWL